MNMVNESIDQHRELFCSFESKMVSLVDVIHNKNWVVFIFGFVCKFCYILIIVLAFFKSNSPVFVLSTIIVNLLTHPIPDMLWYGSLSSSKIQKAVTAFWLCMSAMVTLIESNVTLSG